MRLLVICSQYPPRPSPESNHAILLCEQLAKRKFDVHLLTGPLLPGAPVPSGFTIHPIIDSWRWKGIGKILRAVRDIKPDVILLIYVGWIYENHPLITFAPTLCRFAWRRARFITQFENALGAAVASPRDQKLWRLLALLSRRKNLEHRFGTLLQDSDAIICLSDRHAEALEKVCPAIRTKLAIIPAPPLLRLLSSGAEARSECRRKLGLSSSPEETIALVYFGYIYPGKGVETLLEAFALTRAMRSAGLKPDLKLLIVGSASHEELNGKLRESALRLKVENAIVWAGHQENEDASTYLHGSDIAVLPFDDGLRLNNSSFAVCAEHGLPVVSTRSQPMEEAFKEGINVTLCPPKDPQALALAIKELCDSSCLREKLGRGARDIAERVFSWNKATDATVGVIAAVRRSETADWSGK